MASFTHKTITQGRKTIVFGMPWYTVDEDDHPRKAGVALAKEVRARYDLIVARKEGAPQFGLATSAEGAKSGAFSAAAIVADIVAVDSWIYVLEIESSIWICSGRDGYILPAGDRVYENRDEARRAFHEINPSSFKKIYLPVSWKAASSGDDDLSNVASDIEETDILDFVEYNPPKWGKLSSISSAGSVLKAASAAALLCGIGFAAWTFYTSEPAVEMTAEQRAALLQAQADRLSQERMKERDTRWATYDSNRPWHAAPPSGKILETCLREILQMPTRPVGYSVASIHCGNGTVTAAVERSTGYSTWLDEWAKSQPGISASTNSTGDTGYLTRDFAGISPRGAEQLLSFEDISKEILEVGQIEGSEVQLNTPAAAVIPDEPEYTPYYATSTYRIQSKRPDAWMHVFASHPGITINAVRFNITDQIYTMEGEIYVPNL